MPAVCTVLPPRRLGVVVLHGALDGPQFVAAMEALYEDPAWEPGFSALWDARRVRKLALDPEDVQALGRRIEALAERMGGGRAAFVVPDEFHRMIAVLIVRKAPRADRDRRMFEHLDDALAWLGVEAPVPGVQEAEA